MNPGLASVSHLQVYDNFLIVHKVFQICLLPPWKFKIQIFFKHLHQLLWRTICNPCFCCCFFLWFQLYFELMIIDIYLEKGLQIDCWQWMILVFPVLSVVSTLLIKHIIQWQGRLSLSIDLCFLNGLAILKFIEMTRIWSFTLETIIDANGELKRRFLFEIR